MCSHANFIESAAGVEVQKKLYSETMAEMRNHPDVGGSDRFEGL